MVRSTNPILEGVQIYSSEKEIQKLYLLMIQVSSVITVKKPRAPNTHAHSSTYTKKTADSAHSMRLL